MRGRPVRFREDAAVGDEFAGGVFNIAAPRPSVVQRCEHLGVRLTNKRRRMLEAFDMVETPIDPDMVWRKITELGLDGHRSSMHRLMSDLVAWGVLNEVGSPDRRARFATPLSMTLEVGLPDGSVRPVLDPTLKEMVFRIVSDDQGLSAVQRVTITVEA